MILVIDNYDSFTYNLVQYIGELGFSVKVCRNDMISVSQIQNLNPTHIVISPGPCTPDKAGISLEAIKTCYAQTPILGVCLGHQSIAQAFGAKIVKAKKVMHGKTSSIHHDQKGIFREIKSPFTATRYHSLAVDPGSIPNDLKVTAWTEDGQCEVTEIMAISHEQAKVHGVQFHPESILSEFGHRLLKNFLEER